MSGMQVFTFPVTSQSIRISGNYDRPWFCLSDVCSVLGLSNPSDLAQKQLKQDGLDKIEIIDSLGRKQLVLFVNEANLYRCVMRSSKPNAIAFQDWLVETVVPQIRKTGSFGNVPNHQSSGSEFWQLIDGAIDRSLQPEKVIDWHHRYNHQGSVSPVASFAKTKRNPVEEKVSTDFFAEFADDVGLKASTKESIEVKRLWQMHQDWCTSKGITQGDRPIPKVQNVFQVLKQRYPNISQKKHPKTRRSVICGLSLGSTSVL